MPLHLFERVLPRPRGAGGPLTPVEHANEFIIATTPSVNQAYHAFCARLPAAEPVPAAPSYPYLASYAVFLLSFASVRLLSSFSTRRNNEHEK